MARHNELRRGLVALGASGRLQARQVSERELKAREVDLREAMVVIVSIVVGGKCEIVV